MESNVAGRRPIHYETEQDIRFGDLDPYGHLNAKHFLDLVATSRFTFTATRLDITYEQIVERGVAFYLRKASQHFKAPVVGVQKLFITSHVAGIRDCMIDVAFQVRSRSKSVLHASGTLEYVVVDPATKKPLTSPAWLLDYFFEKA